MDPPSSDPPLGRPAVATRIRRLRESDLEEYRTLRLRSLREDPLAFGSTLAREQAFEPSHWVDRVRQGASGTREGVWVAEGPGGALIGMIGAFPKDGTIHVFGMWVEPDMRQNGLGGKLLDALLDWASTEDPAADVMLSVNPSQLAAVRLYLSRGFQPTGVVEPLGHTPGAVVHEMRRPPKGTAPPSRV